MSVHAHRLIMSYRFKKKKKKGKNVDFGWISSLHKNEFIKPSSSDPNAPNSN